MQARNLSQKSEMQISAGPYSLWRLMERIHSWPCPAPGGLGFLSCVCITLVSALLAHGLPCVSFLLSLLRAFVMDLGPSWQSWMISSQKSSAQLHLFPTTVASTGPRDLEVNISLLGLP